MPRITLYQGGAVQRQGTTGTKLREADYGPSGIGQGLRAVGAALSDHVEVLERLKRERLETEAKDADNTFSAAIADTLYNPETGFYAKRGKDAVDAYEASLEGVEAIRGKVSAGLNPEARRLFDQAAESRLTSARMMAAQHVMKERQVWQDETSKAVILRAKSDAGNAYQTPAEAEKFIATASDEITAIGKRQGSDPAAVEAERFTTVSSIRRDIAGRLTDMKPDLGEQYLNIYRKEFSSEDADKVEDAIRIRRSADQAEQRRLEREARQEAREAAADRAEQARDTVDLIERGNSVDPVSVEKLATRLEQDGKLVLATKLRTSAAVQDFTTEARAWRPDQLQAWINEERAKTLDRASAGKLAPQEAARIEAAEKLLGEMKTALKEDPLSWAVKSGNATLAPIDLAKPETVNARIRTAIAVGDRYGTKPTFLTDEETQSYADFLAKADARAKTATAGAIARNFGRHGRDVLASLSNADPVFAHAAALSAMGGYHAGTARRIFDGQDAIKAKSVELPPAPKFEEHGIGRALAFTPKTRGAILEAAKAIYAGSALKLGSDPKEVDVNAWGLALNRAAGATYRADGSRVGGFGKYRGLDIVLPTDVTPDEFGSLISKITDADLKAGGVPRYADGKPVAAADLRKGYLFDAGAGRYFVSLDSVGSQFLRGPKGPYILNLGGMVSRLRGRR